MLLHPKQPGYKILLSIIAILIIVIGIGLYWHNTEVNRLQERIHTLESNTNSKTPTPDQPEVQPSNNFSNTYNNSTYAYGLRYPDNFDLTAYNDEHVIIGVSNPFNQDEPLNAKVETKVLIAKNSAETNSNVESFLNQQAQNLCETSGGGVSITCPRQKNLTPLTLGSGLTAYVVTLERQERILGPEASTLIDEAVYFFVDLSNSQKRIILALYPVNDGTVEITRSIAETVSQAE